MVHGSQECFLELVEFGQGLVVVFEQHLDEVVEKLRKTTGRIEVESPQVSEVAKSVSMHALHELFLAVEDLEALLFVTVEEVELLDDVFQLRRERHV